MAGDDVHQVIGHAAQVVTGILVDASADKATRETLNDCISRLQFQIRQAGAAMLRVYESMTKRMGNEWRNLAAVHGVEAVGRMMDDSFRQWMQEEGFTETIKRKTIISIMRQKGFRMVRDRHGTQLFEGINMIEGQALV